MLRQRVITAVVLLVLLGAVLGSGSAIAFHFTLVIFWCRMLGGAAAVGCEVRTATSDGGWYFSTTND